MTNITSNNPNNVNNLKPSKELLEALDEGKQILKELNSGKRKGYTNMYDLIKSLNEQKKNIR